MVVLLCLFGLVMRPHFVQFDSSDHEETEVSSVNFEFPTSPQFTFAQDASLGCLIPSRHTAFELQVPIRHIKQSSSIAGLNDVLLAGRSLGGCGS